MPNRRTALKLAAASLLAGKAAPADAAPMEDAMKKPLFLLVHGSWHGPWCWTLLQESLAARGFETATVALPSVGDDAAMLGGFTDDAAAAGAAAAGNRPTIVVGHSYGGAVISEARFSSNVERLVYLAAFMPDSGRSYVSYLPPGPLPPYVGMRNDGTFAVPAGQAIPHFYHDCTADIATWAEAQLRLQSQKVLGPAVAQASWRTIPSTYVLTTEDRALPPDFQRQFVAQAENVHEIATSHSPMLSQPELLADLLVEIARQSGKAI